MTANASGITAKDRVVVVGAGIAGLAAAARLAHEGLPVLLLDRQPAPGGKMRCLQSPAGPVDTGPTVLTMRAVFDELFAEMGERLDDHVTLVPQRILARHFWPDGSQLDLLDTETGSTEAIRNFAGANAARQFRAFSARARTLFQGFEPPMMRAPAPSLPGLVAHVMRNPHLIRPMAPRDLDVLLEAARRLPALMLTVAPETVTPDQIERLAGAGIVVSLGHSDAGFETCRAAADAGATCVTHLFNAMRQLGNRDPGVVGVALSRSDLSAGMIADGHHVHPETMRVALRAKAGPGRIFLVSDAMAVAGTDADGFDLGGRRVLRRDGRLTLEDGTLAGADLDLLTALRNLLRWELADAATALAMATRVPARLIAAAPGIGELLPGGPADFLHVELDSRMPARVWKAGNRV